MAAILNLQVLDSDPWNVAILTPLCNFFRESQRGHSLEANLCMFPLLVIHGIMLFMIQTARTGGKLVIFSEFNIQHYLQAVIKYKVK